MTMRSSPAFKEIGADAFLLDGVTRLAHAFEKLFLAHLARRVVMQLEGNGGDLFPDGGRGLSHEIIFRSFDVDLNQMNRSRERGDNFGKRPDGHGTGRAVCAGAR